MTSASSSPERRRRDSASSRRTSLRGRASSRRWVTPCEAISCRRAARRNVLPHACNTSHTTKNVARARCLSSKSRSSGNTSRTACVPEIPQSGSVSTVRARRDSRSGRSCTQGSSSSTLLALEAASESAGPRHALARVRLGLQALPLCGRCRVGCNIRHATGHERWYVQSDERGPSQQDIPPAQDGSLWAVPYHPCPEQTERPFGFAEAAPNEVNRPAGVLLLVLEPPVSGAP